MEETRDVSLFTNPEPSSLVYIDAKPQNPIFKPQTVVTSENHRDPSASPTNPESPEPLRSLITSHRCFARPIRTSLAKLLANKTYILNPRLRPSSRNPTILDATPYHPSSEASMALPAGRLWRLSWPGMWKSCRCCRCPRGFRRAYNVGGLGLGFGKNSA